MLTGCASAPVATTTEYVEIPVKVVEKLDPKLIADCDPKQIYPATKLKFKDMKKRLDAVEDALAICRNQLELLRAAQSR